MSRAIGTIREFHTDKFAVIVDALPEDSPVDVDDDGETAAAVDAGEFLHFIARVRVIFGETEIASSYLGGCIYRRLEDFEDHRQCGAENRRLAAEGSDARCGSYFKDIVHEAIAEARATLLGARSVHVRG